MGSSADLRWLQPGCLGLLCSLSRAISHPVSTASKVCHIVSKALPRIEMVYTTTLQTPGPAGHVTARSLVMMSAIHYRDVFARTLEIFPVADAPLPLRDRRVDINTEVTDASCTDGLLAQYFF